MITYFDNLIVQAEKLKSFSPMGACSDDSWELVKLLLVKDLDGAKREMQTPCKFSIGTFLSDSIGTILVYGPHMTHINNDTDDHTDLGTEEEARAAVCKVWKNINLIFLEIKQEFHRCSCREQGYGKSLT